MGSSGAGESGLVYMPKGLGRGTGYPRVSIDEATVAIENAGRWGMFEAICIDPWGLLHSSPASGVAMPW